MRLRVRDVLAQLASEGLVPPDATQKGRLALAVELEDELPWYMRAAVALGAWVATILVITSFAAIVRPRSELSWVVIGALLMTAAIVARRHATGEFPRWASVAVALAGHGMVTFGLAAMGADSVVRGALACFVTAAALIWLMPDYTLRFMATLSGGSAVIVALIALRLPHGFDVGIAAVVAALAYVWRGALRTRADSIAAILEPVGYALMIVLFAALLGRTLATSAHTQWSLELGKETGRLGPISTVACALALVALTWKVLDEHGASLSAPLSFALLAGAALLGVTTFDSPGIVAGVAALMLAFDRRDRVLLGMATIFLLVFGSFYYYSLQLTLLQKSGVLVGSGLLLLGIRHRMVRA
jgi:hypothetical protein